MNHAKKTYTILIGLTLWAVLLLGLFSSCVHGSQDAEHICDEFSSIDVVQEVSDINTSDTNQTVVEYTLFIGNPGVTQLKNVTLNVTLPAKMVYSEGFLIGEEEDIPLEKSEERLVEDRWVLRFKVVDVLDTGDTGYSAEVITLYANHVPDEVSISGPKSPNYLETEVRVCALSPINEPVCQSAESPAILA